jgi:hypothetical protein
MIQAKGKKDIHHRWIPLKIKNMEKAFKKDDSKTLAVANADRIWILDFEHSDDPFRIVYVERKGCTDWSIGAEDDGRAYLHFGEYESPHIGESIQGSDYIIHIDDVFLTREEAEKEMNARNAKRHAR